MPKDDSRIDTIGRAIARPQQYSGELGQLALDKYYGLFGDPGVIVGSSILALVAFHTAYQLATQGGIGGWALALYTAVLGLAFVAITFVTAVFSRLDDGESATVLGVHFQK